MKNLFLFTGEETYLLNEQMDAWKRAFKQKHGDINLEVMDAATKPINEIMAAVTAVPFLGDKRLIFVHNLPDKPKTRNKDKVSKADEKRDEQLKKLATDLDDIPETSVVVFVQNAPDKRKSFYKALVKKAELKEFNLLTGSALNQWVEKRFQMNNVRVGYAVIDYLISLTGQSLWRLSTEVEKIVAYRSSSDEVVSKEMIDELVVPTMEANIFHLTDALATKNHRKAIDNLHRSMLAGEKLQLVFYMIVRQLRLLLQGAAFLESGVNPSATAFSAKLKLHPFVARNTLGQARNFNVSDLKVAYGELLEIDTGLKTSKIRVFADDQTELALALEKFILGFCGQK